MYKASELINMSMFIVIATKAGNADEQRSKAVLIHNRMQMCIDASKGVPRTSWPKLANFDIT